MENMRHAKNFGAFQNSSREKRKALSFIRIVPRRSSIESISIKVRRIIYKIKSHASMDAVSYDGTEPVAIIKRHRDAAHHNLGIVQLSLPIAWNIHAHLVSSRHQSTRQGSDHVGQSTSL